MGALRIGTLGAAKITPGALLAPASEDDLVEVVSVAARDPERAAKFAAEHGIPRVRESYAALVEDPEVEAIYNPLPISLHREWTLRALRAGKHVLCEKPFAANAAEAREMVAVGRETGLVLMEAFHWRYHPLASRLSEIIDGGEVGAVRRIEGRFTVEIRDPDDIRKSFALAGGATMDLGCYPIQWLRFVGGGEPEVVSALAREQPMNIDAEMSAELRFPGRVSGFMHCAMSEGSPFEATLRVEGTRGELLVQNPVAPQLGHALRLSVDGKETTETVEGRSTYRHQLEAFAAAVRTGTSVPTGGDDAIANMEAIDAIYRAAGLPVRGERI